MFKWLSFSNRNGVSKTDTAELKWLIILNSSQAGFSKTALLNLFFLKKLMKSSSFTQLNLLSTSDTNIPEFFERAVQSNSDNLCRITPRFISRGATKLKNFDCLSSIMYIIKSSNRLQQVECHLFFLVYFHIVIPFFLWFIFFKKVYRDKNSKNWQIS